MTARDVTRSCVFSPPGTRAIFSTFSGDFFTKLHRRKPGGKGKKSTGENSKKNIQWRQRPKLQISVPCRGQTTPFPKDPFFRSRLSVLALLSAVKQRGREKKGPPDIAPKSFSQKGPRWCSVLSIGVIGKSALEIGHFLRRNFWMISGAPFLSRPLWFCCWHCYDADFLYSLNFPCIVMPIFSQGARPWTLELSPFHTLLRMLGVRSPCLGIMWSVYRIGNPSKPENTPQNILLNPKKYF